MTHDYPDCYFCEREVNVDDDGWGFANIDKSIITFHKECMEQNDEAGF